MSQEVKLRTNGTRRTESRLVADQNCGVFAERPATEGTDAGVSGFREGEGLLHCLYYGEGFDSFFHRKK